MFSRKCPSATPKNRHAPNATGLRDASKMLVIPAEPGGMQGPDTRMQPPKLVSEILRSVLRVARFDGVSVLVLAGFFALVSAASGDVSGAAFGLLIAAAGAIELHGMGLLRA